MLYVDHVVWSGVSLFDAVCARDMEGTEANLANGLRTPYETTRIQIKNRAYSQAEGPHDFFGQARAAGV